MSLCNSDKVFLENLGQRIIAPPVHVIHSHAESNVSFNVGLCNDFNELTFKVKGVLSSITFLLGLKPKVIKEEGMLLLSGVDIQCYLICAFD